MTGRGWLRHTTTRALCRGAALWGVVALTALPPADLSAQQLTPVEIQSLKAQVRANGGRVIVQVRPTQGARLRPDGRSNMSDQAVAAIQGNLQRRGLRNSRRVQILPLIFGEADAAEIDALLADANVLSIEPDVLMPHAGGGVGGLPAPSGRMVETTPWGISRVSAPAAWALRTPALNGAGIKVAFLDSGGDLTHPDLAWAGGYSAVTGSTAPAAWQDDVAVCAGHGTHVAGTIGALQNTQGVVGVAPGVSLYAIKVFENIGGSCLSYASKQIAGLNWAVQQGVRVVSISIGGSTPLASYEQAIAAASAAGTFVVAAAGNNGNTNITYPGNYPDALAIAALTAANTRSSYSNYGPKVFIAAPGDGIESTMPGGGYGVKSGTSMATPHVAGVIALLLADDPAASRAEILARLQSGALDLATPGQDNETGWGLARAYESIAGGTPPPIPLALAVNPASRSASAVAGSTATIADSGTIVLTGTNAGSTAWTATKRKSWTTLTVGSGTGSGTVRWTRNPSGMAAGTYVDTITVTASGAGGSPDQVVDTLVITPAPVPLVLAVNPVSRSASAVAGSTAAIADSGAVVLSGTNAGSTAWTATKRKSWTTLTVGSGTGSGTVRWTRNPTGLIAGTHVDTITVSASGAGGSPDQVVDTLVITPAPVPLVLAVNPASRSASAVASSTAAIADSGAVVLSGTNAGSTAWTATKRKSWTTLTVGSGTGSGTVRWTRNPTGLIAGTHVDTITVSASGAGGSPDQVVDTLVITPAPVPLVLAVNPASRSASAVAGSTATIADSGTIVLTGTNAGSTAWTASKRKAWTTLTVGSGTGSGTVRWTRNPTGLGAGTYVDTITVSASGAGGSPDQVVDTLVITPAPVPLVLAVNPASRSASAVAGSTATIADSGTIVLTGTNAGSTAWAATKRKAWTALTVGSGTGSGTVRWTRNPSGLGAGTYVDTITVSASGAGGSPDQVVDTLVITPAPVPLVLAVNPASRSASAVAGSTAAIADSGAVVLSGTNAGSTAWTATKRKSWTTLIVGSGTGSGTVRWTRNPTGMSAGTYVDTITVSAAGAGGSPDRVVDTLVITAAPVPLTLSVTPSSRWISTSHGSTTLLNEEAIVVLAGDNSGSTPWIAAKRGAWNTLTVGGGVGSGPVRWIRNPTGLAPGTYVDTITVTASGAGAAAIVDTLVVAPEPVPVLLTVSPASRTVAAVAGSTIQLQEEASVVLTGDNSGSIAWSAAKRAAWTTFTVAAGTGSGMVRWTRNPTGLSAGTYVDTIVVAANGASGSPSRVIDTLVITAAPVPLVLTVNPASRSASAVAGSTTTVADSGAVVLAGTNAGSTAWTATKRKSWTTLTAGAGTGSGTVRWTRNPTGLSSGTWVDTITVTAGGGNGLTGRIIDTLVIAGTPLGPPRTKPGRGKTTPISRSTSDDPSLALDSVMVELGGANPEDLVWTATSDVAWLRLLRVSGRGDQSASWRRETDGLASGTHVGRIVIGISSGGSEFEVVFADTVVTGVADPEIDLAGRDLFEADRLTPRQREMLDRLGNRNGVYDVGDFFAWVERTGVAPTAAVMQRLLTIPADSVRNQARRPE